MSSTSPYAIVLFRENEDDNDKDMTTTATTTTTPTSASRRSLVSSGDLLHHQDTNSTIDYSYHTHSLPDELKDVVSLRHPLIAWTNMNPTLHRNQIQRHVGCSAFGPLLFLPCFWPHFIVLSPCLLLSNVMTTNIACRTYWVLTTQELMVVVLDHNRCCCINDCYRTGIYIKTIPLETIVDVGLLPRGGCTGKCLGGSCTGSKDIHTIYVETNTIQVHHHRNSRQSLSPLSITGIGLQHHQWFIQRILYARDAMKYHLNCHEPMRICPYYPIVIISVFELVETVG
jgi:hypothetical protein